MEAVGDADGQADGSDGIAAEVACFENHDVALVAVGIVDVRQDPTVILGTRVGARDEDRLDCSQPQPVRQQTAERQTLCYV